MSTWPSRHNIHSSHLTSQYSIMHKIAICNWHPTTHRIVITKNFSTLLIQIGMKRKFNLGKLVFKHPRTCLECTIWEGHWMSFTNIWDTHNSETRSCHYCQHIWPQAAELPINHNCMKGIISEMSLSRTRLLHKKGS